MTNKIEKYRGLHPLVDQLINFTQKDGSLNLGPTETMGLLNYIYETEKTMAENKKLLDNLKNLLEKPN